MADFSGIALPADVTDLLAEDLGEADTTFPDLLLAYQNELASPELLPAHVRHCYCAGRHCEPL